jgi:hypothetical protein
MKVKDVLADWNRRIPYPWTKAKLRKAGYTDTKDAFFEIVEDLKKCEDALTAHSELPQFFKDVETVRASK